MTALQDLGEELLALPPEQLRAVDLPERLLDAIDAVRRITDHEGRRRQMQFIGRLMRDVDPEPLRALVDASKVQSKRATAQLHLVENWRDRLLADDDSLTRLIEQLGGRLAAHDIRELRNCVRQAREERKQARPPRHARELFQLVRRHLVEAGASHDE